MTTALKERRTLRYESLDHFLQDAETLAAGKCETVGDWSFGQILTHLGNTLNSSIDGFGFTAPWVARTLVAPFMKTRFLTKAMPSGFKLPKTATALMPPDGVTTDEALAALRKAISRFADETPGAAHPFFGKMTRDEWGQLHLRHAELHMSFVRSIRDTD
jgi:hypothetical protein